MKRWHLVPEHARGEAARRFPDLDGVFALAGEVVARDSLASVLRVSVGGRDYFVKRYAGSGKKPLRRLLATPRVQAESRNLQRFAAWGIPTAPVVAYGQERRRGRFVRGALVTEGIAHATDMRKIGDSRDPRLRDRHWRDSVSRQLAAIARTLHRHRFAHNDLKWRNVLVDDGSEPTVYLIDCPTGRFWRWPFLERRIVKDLACLDKLAKRHLSRPQRLRFYLDYVQKRRLDAADRKRIRRIVGYFDGRE